MIVYYQLFSRLYLAVHPKYWWPGLHYFYPTMSAIGALKSFTYMLSLLLYIWCTNQRDKFILAYRFMYRSIYLMFSICFHLPINSLLTWDTHASLRAYTNPIKAMELRTQCCKRILQLWNSDENTNWLLRRYLCREIPCQPLITSTKYIPLPVTLRSWPHHSTEYCITISGYACYVYGCGCIPIS